MLLGLKNLSLHIGNTVLLDRVNLTIERGERVCLVGRNGMGKSTLMKLIEGSVRADDGEVIRSQGLRIARLEQDVPQAMNGSVYDVIAQGLGEVGELVARYHHLLEHAHEHLDELGRVQAALEARDGWALESRVQATITRLDLPADTDFAALSGGLKRRTLLGRALVAEPDLLMLDEPTNHLDITSITWLEEFLSGYEGALLFITHDRAFLRRLATRIIELDRGLLSTWPGDYDNYLRRKAEALHAESQQNALFDKRMAQEEVWIRKGIEARRTRDMGRVKRLMEMREQYAERRNLQGQAKFTVQEAERSGKLVAEAKNLSYSWGDKPLIHGFSATVIRGDKIGFIGPNGVGKTTLLNLLLGKLQPSSGQIKIGTNLEVAYFDQLRAKLDDDKSVAENIGDGKDFVELNGQRKHVMGYSQDFLFTPDRARSPVRVLSGGERNRLLLARLFAQPANLLVLDEPTNDLDVETLDLLEELLLDFSGTVLLVSHDRDFLNQVVTRSFVFEGQARVNEYVGGYDDWLRQKEAVGLKADLRTAPAGRPSGRQSSAAPARMGYKDKRELDALPGLIERLESEQASLIAKIASAGFYQGAKADILAVQARMAALQRELADAYGRWEALEAQRLQ